jgi:hypothetical protein
METLARISKLLGVSVESLYNKQFIDSVWMIEVIIFNWGIY